MNFISLVMLLSISKSLPSFSRKEKMMDAPKICVHDWDYDNKKVITARSSWVTCKKCGATTLITYARGD